MPAHPDRSTASRPRVILEAIGRAYPGAWAGVDRVRASRGDVFPDWPAWCFMPLHGAYAIVAGSGRRVPLERTHHTGIIGALAAWRVGQVVIRFDPALYGPLVETPVSGDLPTEMLYRLPVWCLYLETPGLSVWGRSCHGVWVHLDWDERGHDELRLLLDVAETPDTALDPLQGLVPVALILGQGSVEDALRRVVASGEAQVQALGYAGANPDPRDIKRTVADLAPILSLVLYLCSEAPEWPGPPPVNPKPKRTRRHGLRLFSADKPTTWDVGERLGAALRAAEHEAEPRREAGRSSPRAHIRRAHWHTFRTGPGRQESQLRWLPPIPVRLDSLEDLPTTIRPVRE